MWLKIENLESLREYRYIHSGPHRMMRDEAITTIQEALSRVYGLCTHPSAGAAIPPAAKDCRECVAEHVVDFLEERKVVRWDSLS